MLLSRRSLLAGGLAAAAASLPGRAFAEETKRYHSDYFSFVGSDAQGSVYLAHDNNRGQTGERFFADHVWTPPRVQAESRDRFVA